MGHDETEIHQDDSDIALELSEEASDYEDMSGILQDLGFELHMEQLETLCPHEEVLQD